MGFIDGYVVSGSESVTAVLRDQRNLSPKPTIAMAIKNLFGTPLSAMHIYHNDVSGIALNPLPGTDVPPRLRIYHYQHSSAHRFLAGDALRQMTERFMGFLSDEIHHDPSIGGEWSEMPDLYDFWKSRIFCAAVKSLFGPSLLSLNPSFERDFWDFVNVTPTLMKGLPRWVIPNVYRARDKVLAAVKNWHRFARRHSAYRKNKPHDPAWDEYWGSAWIKERQQFGQESGEMDEDAMASEDMGLIFAANATTIISAVWFTLQIYTDPNLKAAVQPEFDHAIKRTAEASSGPLRFDITALVSSPLSNPYTPRSCWLFQRGRCILLSTQAAGHDPKAWSAHTDGGKRPLDQFWAERFLVPSNIDKTGDEDTRGGTTEKQFSLNGLSAAWIPYGGGAFMCPGRHFAKQEIIGCVAVCQAYYDMEIVGKPDGWMPKPNVHFCCFGVMPPGEKVPFRIRRKVGQFKTNRNPRTPEME